MKCGICCEDRAATDMQELNCKHNFCVQCLAQCSGVEGNTVTQISFGTLTLSVLDLDERQRCEARRGAFACVNVARMHLINCRHRFCYDCLSEKIDCDVYHRDVPSCPLAYCCNRISRSEIRTLAHRSVHLKNLCAAAEKLVSDPPSEMAAVRIIF
nr:Protein Y57G11C.48 [Haemonchus contortus]